MTKAKILVSLVAVFALAILTIASVSAFASIQSVEISNVETDNIAAVAGDILPVRVTFSAYNDAEDVRVKAWLAGESDLAVSTGRFDVYSGNLYTKVLNVKVPTNIDPTEDIVLYVAIESKAGIADAEELVINAQRESYNVAFLDVDMASRVNAGDSLSLDVVLKNRGSHLAEDSFVKVTIPALNIVENKYFGDLSAVDDSDNDRVDSAERTLVVQIPSNAEPGIYDVIVEAYNGDSEASVTKKVAVVGGAREDTTAVSAVKSKTFAVGEEAVYSLTLVNSGDNIKVYQLSADSTDKALSVSVDEAYAVVPAGSSQTVKVRALASEAGQYTFTVKAIVGSEVASEANFVAKVSGSKGITSGNDAAVLLTVVLAVIFVVLLVVLIVLLTRKPQKTEEFGESYY